MKTRQSPESIRADIATFLTMWKKNPGLSLPDLDANAYQGLVDEFQQHDGRIKELDMDRDESRIAREEVMTKMAAYHTRLRSITRGLYGPDSAQMNQAGMVRNADRKSRTRTATATTDAA